MLLQTQRHEPQFAFRIGHQQKRELAAILLQLVDLGLEVIGGADRFLRHLDDGVAGGEALLRGRRILVDAGDVVKMAPLPLLGMAQ